MIMDTRVTMRDYYNFRLVSLRSVQPFGGTRSVSCDCIYQLDHSQVMRSQLLLQSPGVSAAYSQVTSWTTVR